MNHRLPLLLAFLALAACAPAAPAADETPADTAGATDASGSDTVATTDGADAVKSTDAAPKDDTTFADALDSGPTSDVPQGDVVDVLVDASPLDDAVDATADAPQSEDGDAADLQADATADACDVAACPTATEICVEAVCTPQGTCGYAPVADGLVAPDLQAGDCKKRVCVGGVLTDKPDTTDLPFDDKDCTADICDGDTPLHPSVMMGAACGPTGAQFCNGAGACVACTQDSQCAGETTDCAAPACFLGVCTFSYASPGKPLAAQNKGDCKRAVCGAAGSITETFDDGDSSDDQNPCTEDTCVTGVNAHVPTKIDTPCGDGVKCDGKAACVACTAASDCGTVKNACLVAICSPEGTCGTAPRPDGEACNDGSACSQMDTCQAGVCTGGDPVKCAAMDGCHLAGTCDPSTGACSAPLAVDGTPCDDDNACTQADACQAGVCTGSKPVVCVGADPCHVPGTCDPATGVCSKPAADNGTGCDDGNLCTQSDTCQSGVCAGAKPVNCVALDACHVAGVCAPQTGFCSNPVAADTTQCDDGNLCTLADTCQAGVCVGANPVVCVAQDLCHVAGVCVPEQGVCTVPLAADGTPCDDGNACSTVDACQAGVCVGAAPIVCAALDDCHAIGSCDPVSGTCSTPAVQDNTLCNDGNACSQTDTCQAGVCQGANPVVCTPADTCHTAGTCDPATALCTSPTRSDGSLCGNNGLCKAGTCALPTFTVSVNGQSATYYYNTAQPSPTVPTSGSATIDRSGTVTTTNDGCNAFAPDAFAGKIALIRRGTCSFYSKASNAQNAGAVAVVIYNNAGVATLSASIAGTPPIAIPVVGITAPDGVAIDAAIASGLATLQWNAP